VQDRFKIHDSDWVLEDDPRPMQTYDGCGSMTGNRTISLAWCTPPTEQQKKGSKSCHYRFILLDDVFVPDRAITSFSMDQLYTALCSQRGKFGRSPAWTLYSLSQEHPETASQLMENMKQPPFQPCMEYGKFPIQPKPPKGKSLTILF